MPGVVDRHVHIGFVRAGRGGGRRRDRGARPGLAARATSTPWPRVVRGPDVRRPPDPVGRSHDHLPRRLPDPGRRGRRRGPDSRSGAPDEAAERSSRVARGSTAPVVKVALNADVGPTLSDDELVACATPPTGARPSSRPTCRGAARPRGPRGRRGGRVRPLPVVRAPPRRPDRGGGPAHADRLDAGHPLLRPRHARAAHRPRQPGPVPPGRGPGRVRDRPRATVRSLPASTWGRPGTSSGPD